MWSKGSSAKHKRATQIEVPRAGGDAAGPFLYPADREMTDVAG